MEKKIRKEIKYSSDEWSKVIELYRPKALDIAYDG